MFSWMQVWLCFCLFVVPLQVDCVGIKRRLADAEAAEAAADAPEAKSASASSSAPLPKGGIQRRMREHEAAEVAADAASTSSGVPLPKGGMKRRVEAEFGGGSSSSSKKPKGPLVDKLIKKWAAGKISAKDVQDTAFAAVGQGAEGMDGLSALGKSGQQPQNCYRALKNLLGLPSGAPTFSWAEIPTIHGPRTAHPFLLPHEFFRQYYLQLPDKWNAVLAGPKGAALEFWTAMRGTDFLRLHPNLPKKNWATTIPIGMHGDGAAFSHHDSVYTFSWNSLLGSGSTVQKRFVTTIIKKSDMVEGTVDAICKVLSWSFNTMLSGSTPALGWEGQDMEGSGQSLAGGWRGALCQVRGDWAWYCELFSFPQWNGAERMCWMCKASSTNPLLAWTKFGPDAKWRDTRWTHEKYLEFLRAAGIAIPALLILALGFRLECVMIDVLHTVDQGTASHMIANVFWHFAVRRKAFGAGTQEACINKLFKHMQDWYATSKPSSKLKGALTVDRVRTRGGWPKLKAKAAATRHLAAYALRLCIQFGTAVKEDRQILSLCQLLLRFYEILESESQFLSVMARTELPDIGLKFVGLYTALATAAKQEGVKMWKLNPKLHLFLHLCEWQAITQGNPRFYWTYADEDLQGAMSEVAQSCHPMTMAPSAMFKWLWLSFAQ